eukprot:Filipodium_phascolosomae@DN2422_c0_g1_i5.p1
MGCCQNNVNGTLKVLELAAKHPACRRFILASSSSVYGEITDTQGARTAGASTKTLNEWVEDESCCDYPISPYACTKRCCELWASTVSRVYGLPTICLRFFTVYGPRGRPDMAVHQFIEAMRLDTEIVLYGDGSARRAFTFIDDIVDGIVAALECKKKGFEIVNLGGATSHSVAEVIQELETIFNKRAVIEQRPSQPGDVSYTG